MFDVLGVKTIAAGAISFLALLAGVLPPWLDPIAAALAVLGLGALADRTTSWHEGGDE